MFSLKSPSLLSFREQTTVERENLKNIYHIEDLPGDTQMRAGLDPISPGLLRGLFAKLFAVLQKAGIVKQYESWRNYVLVSVDGVSHFPSTKIHCPHCTTRTLRDGTTCYQHAGLAAVLVHPQQPEVFPLDFEPIVNEDGAVLGGSEAWFGTLEVPAAEVAIPRSRFEQVGVAHGGLPLWVGRRGRSGHYRRPARHLAPGRSEVAAATAAWATGCCRSGVQSGYGTLAPHRAETDRPGGQSLL